MKDSCNESFILTRQYACSFNLQVLVSRLGPCRGPNPERLLVEQIAYTILHLKIRDLFYFTLLKGENKWLHLLLLSWKPTFAQKRSIYLYTKTVGTLCGDQTITAFLTTLLESGLFLLLLISFDLNSLQWFSTFKVFFYPNILLHSTRLAKTSCASSCSNGQLCHIPCHPGFPRELRACEVGVSVEDSATRTLILKSSCSLDRTKWNTRHRSRWRTEIQSTIFPPEKMWSVLARGFCSAGTDFWDIWKEK